MLCRCPTPHPALKIVLTGGPGAGKTAVLELLKLLVCRHVVVLPEAASVLFSGGFLRGRSHGARQATQRAIFSVQRQLEAAAEAELGPAVVVCDRGTVDGFAYWPVPPEFWAAMGTTAAAEQARYDVVIHLRTPPAQNGYNYQNPTRIESPEEAARIDARIIEAWAGHPRRVVVESAPGFMTKAERALAVIGAALPACCRGHAFDRHPLVTT